MFALTYILSIEFPSCWARALGEIEKETPYIHRIGDVQRKLERGEG